METRLFSASFSRFLVVAIFCFFHVEIAWAETIYTVDCVDGDANSGQCLTAVSGLVVSGTAYDVYFTEESFLNLFGDPASATFNPPTFWEDQTTSGEAFSAIVDIVDTNGLGGYRTDNSTTLWGEVTVPYSTSGDNILSWSLGFGPDLLSPLDVSRPTAIFTPVPLPSAFHLFASGILGLIAMSRTRANRLRASEVAF